MKLDDSFPDLETLVRRLGAPTSSWRIGQVAMTELEELRTKLATGIEIDLAEIDSDFGGLLTYRGQQILLYIMDTRQDRETLLYDKKKARRFHFFNCNVLETMREKGRYERYVVTQRNDGLFRVFATDPMSREIEELEAHLGPCMVCLKELDYRGYADAPKRQKKAIWSEFTIDDLFAEYVTFFADRPRHTDNTAPPPGYAPDWSKISLRYRELMNWTCQECTVNLAEHRSYLHTHHISGVTSDNSNSNLRALCVICHREEPGHGRMHIPSDARSLIPRLRIKQGIA